jgi:hypothetical protein
MLKAVKSWGESATFLTLYRLFGCVGRREVLLPNFMIVKFIIECITVLVAGMALEYGI